MNKLFTLTKKDNFFVRYSYRTLQDGSTEMTYHEEVLNGELESVTNMTPMNKLKEIMES